MLQTLCLTKFGTTKPFFDKTARRLIIVLFVTPNSSLTSFGVSGVLLPALDTMILVVSSGSSKDLS